MPVLSAFSGLSVRGWRNLALASSDFELISSIILASPASIVNFTGLPASYKHLQVRYSSRNDSTGYSGDDIVRLNGDTGNLYTSHNLWANNGTVGATGITSSNKIQAVASVGSSLPVGTFASGVIDILDFASAVKKKTVRVSCGFSCSTSGEVKVGSSFYDSVAPITSVAFAPFAGSYVAGTRFSLYGLRG